MEIHCITYQKKKNIHCIKPQIQNHSNKAPTSRDFKRSKGLSISSKVWMIMISTEINLVGATITDIKNWPHVHILKKDQ